MTVLFPDTPDHDRPDRDDGVGSVTPEAELAAITDPHRTPTPDPAPGRVGGVRWVRAQALLSELTTAVAGHSIDLHTELARRARTTPAAGAAAAARVQAFQPATTPPAIHRTQARGPERSR